MAEYLDLVVTSILIMITGGIMIIAAMFLIFMKLHIVTLVPEVLWMMGKIVKLTDQSDLPGAWIKVLRAKIKVKKKKRGIRDRSTSRFWTPGEDLAGYSTPHSVRQRAG